MWTKYSTEVLKIIKISSYFSSYLITSFIVIFIMPSSARIGCVNSSGYNPSLSFHQIPSSKRKKINKNGFAISNVDRMKNIFLRIQYYTSS